jgi:hypothetical protein
MHLQTQPTQVFTVFGGYVLERKGGYFPLTRGWFPIVQTAGSQLSQNWELRDAQHDPHQRMTILHSFLNCASWRHKCTSPTKR